MTVASLLVRSATWRRVWMVQRVCGWQGRFFADKVIKTPYMADSITQGTLASWEKRMRGAEDIQ